MGVSGVLGSFYRAESFKGGIVDRDVVIFLLLEVSKG